MSPRPKVTVPGGIHRVRRRVRLSEESEHRLREIKMIAPQMLTTPSPSYH